MNTQFNLDVDKMNGENGLLVKSEPIEFEKQPVEVQNFRKITNCFLRDL